MSCSRITAALSVCLLVHVPSASAQAQGAQPATATQPGEEPEEPESDGSDQDGNVADDQANDQAGSEPPDVGEPPVADEISEVSRPRFADEVEIIDDGTAPPPDPEEATDEQVREPAPPVTYRSDPEARERGKRAAERRAQAAEGGNFGGYFNSPEDPERAPPDGERNLLIGTILLPLGSLQLAGGLLTAILGMQPRCGELFDYSDSSCNGMVGYGATGASLGGLMAVTGAVFLGMGLSQRGKHQRWKRKRGQAARVRIGGTGLVLQF